MEDQKTQLSRKKERYTYNVNNFKPPPKYEPVVAVNSVEEFGMKMLNTVAGGSTNDKHMEYLTKKLNEIGFIIHQKKNNIPLNFDQKMTLLMAETWIVNRLVAKTSKYDYF